MKLAHRLDHSPFIVVPEKRIRLKDYDPGYTAGFHNKAEAKAALSEDVSGLATAQELLWASKEYSLVILLQGLDAAGKDGIIKHVMSDVNPLGVEVHSFKAPTEEERLRHFLWRPARLEPARGRLAIFNRSYYEEVLVVRVHPEFLQKQPMPRKLRGKDLKEVWKSRYEDINAFERTWARNNVCLLKFFLNVSRKEQKKRFLDRLKDPEKHWKFSAQDVRERAFWDQYREAYEDMLNATSTRWAPWYIIPADNKWFTRACIADIITKQVEDLNLKLPELSEKEKTALEEAHRELKREKSE